MTQLLSALLTNSRLKCFRKCIRLHQLKYEMGYRPVSDPEELDFGSAVHAALEAWWLAVKAGLPPDEWYALAIAALRAFKARSFDAFACARAEAMISGYHAKWAQDAGQFEVLGVEEAFEYALVNPATGGRSPMWSVAGKLDVRVKRRSDGAHGFIDHKTSGEDIGPGSTYWARLKMDTQVSTYFDGGVSLGHDFSFCLYDVLRKPGQRPLKATPLENRKLKKDGTPYANVRLEDETPEEYQARCMEAILATADDGAAKYYQRGEVPRLEAELDAARWELWQQAAQLREANGNNRHPRNPDACTAMGQTCPFFAVCCGEASLENPALFFRTDNVHPELAGHPTSGAGPKEEA